MRVEDSKGGGREKFSELFLLPSRGREHLVFFESSEEKYLVTCDRILCPPPPSPNRHRLDLEAVNPVRELARGIKPCARVEEMHHAAVRTGNVPA